MGELGYNGHRGTGGRGGVRDIMDFLAEEASGRAGTGCPGLKRVTGGWLPQ